MSTYNDIGIDANLDWDRIAKLFRIGLFAAVMAFVGDLLLGWGVTDESLTGIERELSAYLTLSDARIFWSAFLGMIGMALTMLVDVFGNVAWANALAAGWISIGNIWMFGGLLLMMKRVKKEIER